MISARIPVLRIIALVGFASALNLGAMRAEAEEVPRLEPADCVTPELVAAKAKCFMFFGQENRDAPNGTIVELPVAVIAPAKEADPPNPDPLFFFPGGPGITALDRPEWIREDAGNRTVVLVEHRGFVHAKPTLDCPGRMISPYQNTLSPVAVSSTDMAERLAIFTASVERCYEKLVAAGIDVSRYNEYEVARDADEIRGFLGYDKINIYGYSTGGGSVLSYLRYYPDRVRAIVFGAPWFGEYRNRAALDEYFTLKQTYTDILSICVSTQPGCRERIPAWMHAIDRTRHVLDEKPYQATVQAADGRKITLTFDGVAFMGHLYAVFEGKYMKLPNILARTQRGDYSTLHDFFDVDEWKEVSPDDSDDYIPWGYYLAHICGDMGPNRPTKADTLAMLESEPALLTWEDPKICAWWGADGAVPAHHNDWFPSDVPGFSIHGQVDIWASVRWGYYLAQRMSNLQVIDLRALGHELPGTCRAELISKFLEDPYAKLDDSCKNDASLGPWVLE